ncbi:MAG TPA: GNAT family N-acetyltransferase [Candidatus Saccharimonadales bacterium]|nr:GNAT family N-acetyltransferase [Candidatus Saccharimonadales bacterium]
MYIRFAKKSDISFLITGLEKNRIIEERPNDQIQATAQDKKELKKAIIKKQIRVVEDTMHPIAFLYFRTDFSVMYIQKSFVWVDLIYVDEAYREKGIGTMLYNDVIKIAREKDLHTLVIDIFSTNKNSISFHKKLGFQSLYSIYTKQLSY